MVYIYSALFGVTFASLYIKSWQLAAAYE